MYKYAFTKKVGLDLTIGTYHQKVALVDTIDPEQIVEEEEEEDEPNMIETELRDPDQIPEESESYAIGPYKQESSKDIDESPKESQNELASQQFSLHTATTMEDPIDKASNDLRAFIISNLSVKVEELKGVLGQKIQAQEDVITAQLKRMDEGKKGKK
jgi:hypothetical protein